MTDTGHEVKFERNVTTGRWRGRCSTCGWFWLGTAEEVQSRAATHDIEWVEESPPTAPVQEGAR